MKSDRKVFCSSCGGLDCKNAGAVGSFLMDRCAFVVSDYLCAQDFTAV